MKKVASGSLGSLSPGIGSRIQIVTGEGERRESILTTLLGYSEERFVILKLPVRSNGAPITYQVGQPLSVRLFTGVSIGIFEAKVMRCELEPFFSLHTTYPENLQVVSIRNAIRVQTRLLCTLKTTSSEIAGMLLNLSSGGCLIGLDSSTYAVGGAVELSFSLTSDFDSTETEHRIQSLILSIDQDNKDAELPVRLGLQFLNLAPAELLALKNYAYGAILTDRRRII